MTTDEARELIRTGALWGDVAPLLDLADRAELAAWFVCEPGLPNLAARSAVALTVPAHDPEKPLTVPAHDPEKPLAEFSGRPRRDPPRFARDERIHDEPCHKCGCQRFIQTGKCKTCCECGESGGCV